jgi:redox-regulated HSP33 family molecular chaperone
MDGWHATITKDNWLGAEEKIQKIIDLKKENITKIFSNFFFRSTNIKNTKDNWSTKRNPNLIQLFWR